MPLILVFGNGENEEREEDIKKFGRYSFEKGRSCLHTTQKEGGVETKEKSVSRKERFDWIYLSLLVLL